MKYGEDDVQDNSVLTHENLLFARRSAMFFKGNLKSLNFIWSAFGEIPVFHWMSSRRKVRKMRR